MRDERKSDRCDTAGRASYRILLDLLYGDVFPVFWFSFAFTYVQIRSYADAPMVPMPNSCPIRPHYVHVPFRPDAKKVSNAILHSSAA